jgi:uncharacterized protein YdeI (YjbR/CyaY-like superfamily)
MQKANPTFFRTPADMRRWFARNHDTATELLVGFYKRGSDKPSVTWPESVDEALCVGWIDGIRRRVGDESYTIRFTPRRKGSVWSAVNTRRVEALRKDGRMTPAGEKAFEARKEYRSGIYSYEQRPQSLVEPYAGMLARNKSAARFLDAQPPWYRKAVTWWILSAKKEETRLSRLKTLIDDCAHERTLKGLTRSKAGA